MIKYALFFVAAFGLAALLTPGVRILALRWKVLDRPGRRKIHTVPIPLLGGVPLFLAFNVVVFAGGLTGWLPFQSSSLSRWPLFLAGQAVILAAGVLDDRLHLPPRLKILLQILAGSQMVLAGFVIGAVKNPLTGAVVSLGLFSIPVTILWIVGITNALNLVDGLDGLASGIAFMVALAVFGISLFHQNVDVALAAAALAGCLLGFLIFNFHPARIFLGDSGSLWLGYMLAVLSIEGSSKEAVLVTMTAPILALGLPIMETLLSMGRRFAASAACLDKAGPRRAWRYLRTNLSAMFQADLGHVHYRLMGFGFTHRRAVLLLYAVGAVLCLAAFLILVMKNIAASIFLAALAIAAVAGVRTLDYHEIRNGTSAAPGGRSVPPVWGMMIALADLGAVSLAYYLAFQVVFRDFGGDFKRLFIRSFPILLAIKLAVLLLTGVSRPGLPRRIGPALGRAFAAALVATALAAAVLILTFGLSSFRTPRLFLVDAALFLPLLAFIRLAWRAFQRSREEGDPERSRP